MRQIKKVLIHPKSGKKYFIKNTREDYFTQYGTVSANDLRKKELKSDKGHSFVVLDPQFSDVWEHFHKGPQIMQQKDIGILMARTGVNNNSVVVDAGGGSGSLCLSLANVCKEITVYEKNPEHYDVVAKNIKLLGFKNVTLKQENVYKGIAEKNVDIITLDLPEPWQVIEHAVSALKLGGHLVVYLPNLNQVKMFIDACKGSSIKVVETLELLERKWKIEDRIMRPEFQMLGHTGFMVFCRRF